MFSAPPTLPDYVYRGDKHTCPTLRGKGCWAVRNQQGKCIRGKNGSMLVRFQDGLQHVVVGRQLRKWEWMPSPYA